MLALPPWAGGEQVVHGRRAIADLFTNGTDAIHIIQWKDVFTLLEETIDACEDAANVIERIVVGDGSLTLIATGADEDGVARVEQVLGSHLERFGQRNELSITWARAPADLHVR